MYKSRKRDSSFVRLVIKQQPNWEMSTLSTLFVTLLGVFPQLIQCCHPLTFSVIDLSHTLESSSLKWPTASDFKFSILARGWVQNKFWYEMNKFDTPEHISTHLDAPAHFSDTNWKLHEIPADRLVGPGVVIDIRDRVVNDPDYRLQISDIESWESVHGTIPKGAVVFMWSGWDSRYPDKTATFNSETPDDTSTFHFPGFHPEAVRWLIDNRSIGMVGVDTPSTDYGQSVDFEVHQIISKANVLGLENVNNLMKLPATGSTIVVAPIKVVDGSGVPIRLLALLNQDGQPLCETNYKDGTCFRP
ncbi:isatin hydrolase-like isoform X2 [Biomphalaria glabrata]|uniref:Isatin hydrolase-like isoform X2 n=1 Tax=Biomphalaria glabrata TaxID=6526 RepID=A0A9W3AP66_BIOGL|nr:isatin hydrolase-like isoform X2 [Biomphalaria glabrata]